MKQYKVLLGAAALLLASSVACTDEIAVGDAGLDKATSSTATIDTVFTNAEFARQFLIGIYSKQYYGLPYTNGGTYQPHAGNPYAGKSDGLTDCWHQFWNGSAVFGKYYNGSLTAYVTRPDGLDGPLYSYDKEYQWYSIRASLIFLANLDRVPSRDMGDDEKFRLKAEARCLMVDAFWQTFQRFGGIPIMDHVLENSETVNPFPRDSVEKCIDWMVNQLDSAIVDSHFPWVTEDPTNMSGRWTKAGAMALKCKILQFAASPLLNPQDGQPYYTGAPAEVIPFIMYTSDAKTTYQQRWDRFATACDEFFDRLNSSGYYALMTADGSPKGSTEANVPAFRLAYRKGYFLRSSTEEPFNWQNASDRTYKEAKTVDGRDTLVFLTNSKTGAITRQTKSLHTMFVRGSIPSGSRQLNTVLTRDPRLYEECIVNGLQKNLDWTTATMSGYPWELWYNGADGGTGVFTQTNTMFGSGYGYNKYYLGTGAYSGDASADSYRYQTQWVALSLADMYLTYAEALVMRTNKDVAKAVEMVDKVRERVGLPTMSRIWTMAKNRDAAGYTANSAEAAVATAVNLPNGYTTNEFIEELLDERVRELGLTDARWFDMIRYKRTDWMTKQLHGLLQHRLVSDKDAAGNMIFVERNVAWVGADRDNDESSTQPVDFRSEVVEIKGNARVLWGQDPKSNTVQQWLLNPLPQAEINKQYGLVQNPGW